MASSEHHRFPSTKDYHPSNMADQSDQSALQLDFYQAMSDFRHMFPNMDEEIIEAVLRANNGAVDSTIDQLLTMNVDFDGHPTDGRGPQRTSKSKQSKMQSFPPEFQVDSSSSGEDEDPWAPPPYPPPSYSDYTRSTGDTKKILLESQTLEASDCSAPASADMLLIDAPLQEKRDFAEMGAVGGSCPVDLITPGFNQPHGDSDLPPTPHTPMPPKMALLDHRYTPQQAKLVPKKLYGSKWNPPMLGKLPEDFLRLSVDSARDCSVHGSMSSPCHSYTVGSSGGSSPRGSAGSSPRSATRGRAPALQMRSSSELSSQVLQQRMAENQQKRDDLLCGQADPERAQYLEDERLALCLQNKVFLQELRGDEEFMKTLQRDRMNATAFEPVWAQHTDPKLSEPDMEPGRPKPDQFEGYGDQDRDTSLGAFPFEKQVPCDENAEFRRQLNQMGGSSRKKFMALARNFFSRKKKKTPQQILKETSAPSTANLLEEDYDSSDEEALVSNRPTTPDTMEGSPFIADQRATIPKYKTEQLGAAPECKSEQLGTVPEYKSEQPGAVPEYRTVQRPHYHPDTVITYNHGDHNEMC